GQRGAGTLTSIPLQTALLQPEPAQVQLKENLMHSVFAFVRNFRTQCLALAGHLVWILVAFGLMAAPPSSATQRTVLHDGPIPGPRCPVTPPRPVGVPAGGTYSFQAANCGSGAVTWQVSGQGSIDHSCNYTAP